MSNADTDGKALVGWPSWPEWPSWPGNDDGCAILWYHKDVSAYWEERARAMINLLEHFESVLDRDEDRQKCADVLARVGTLPPLPEVGRE